MLGAGCKQGCRISAQGRCHRVPGCAAAQQCRVVQRGQRDAPHPSQRQGRSRQSGVTENSMAGTTLSLHIVSHSQAVIHLSSPQPRTGSHSETLGLGRGTCLRNSSYLHLQLPRDPGPSGRPGPQSESQPGPVQKTERERLLPPGPSSQDIPTVTKSKSPQPPSLPSSAERTHTAGQSSVWCLPSHVGQPPHRGDPRGTGTEEPRFAHHWLQQCVSTPAPWHCFQLRCTEVRAFSLQRGRRKVLAPTLTSQSPEQKGSAYDLLLGREEGMALQRAALLALRNISEDFVLQFVCCAVGDPGGTEELLRAQDCRALPALLTAQVCRHPPARPRGCLAYTAAPTGTPSRAVLVCSLLL